ncbi:MAG TPA: ABC transporter permease subunit [Solirubrobacteraceae bacterium]|nr:ABC transporter permease subunit [Solirubrobacteraceae bacterium]
MNAFASGQLDLAPRRRGRRSSIGTWRWSDRIVLLGAWAAGLTLCAIAGAIVLYMGVRGIQYLHPSLLVSSPEAALDQSHSGGILDPILGTALLSLIGILIATPLAVCSAVWIAEYGRPRWLGRIMESSIEVIAGTPDIVIAIFGLALFQTQLLAGFSFVSTVGGAGASGGGVFGRSFLAAGSMMSLIAIPPIFAATREGLQALPTHMREAAYALGKTRIATIRRVLLPGVRSNIATGATLGISRIIGDTAIVVLLLGASLRIEPAGSTPGLDVLRGTGSTLTSFVYDNSPAGEGNAPQKAYAAAFLLMLLVLALNATVNLIARAHERRTGQS